MLTVISPYKLVLIGKLFYNYLGFISSLILALELETKPLQNCSFFSAAGGRSLKPMHIREIMKHQANAVYLSCLK